MKAKIRALLERFIREGIDHAIINSDAAPAKTTQIEQLANEIDNRIWLYIDEYFDFDVDFNL